MSLQLGPDQRPELGVDGGEDFGQRFDLGDGQASHGQPVGHLQAHVTGPDDQGAGRAQLVQ